MKTENMSTVRSNLLQFKQLSREDRFLLARRCGITVRTLEDRIEGKSEFRLREIAAISDFFQFTDCDIMSIFFPGIQ